MNARGDEAPTILTLENFPEEIFLCILSFVPSFRDLAQLARVNKRFSETIREEKSLWKSLCLDWWYNHGFTRRKLDLEWAQSVASKDWTWFGKAFLNESKESGLCFKFCEELNDCWIEIGEVQNSFRNGWGMIVYDDQIHMGNFKDDLLHGEGYHVWKSGEKYTGSFEKNKRHGYGLYTWPGMKSSDRIFIL